MSYITDKFDDKVMRLLEVGAVGFMPSDTIYGLSCLALNERAVERLREIKKRSKKKRMIVLIASLDQLDDLKVDKEQIKDISKYWPGALTAICKAEKSPVWLNRGQGEFGIRMPLDKKLTGLIKIVGPLISTSANFEGEEPLVDPEEARQYFGESLDFYVDSGIINGQPSTIVDITGGRIDILRQGAVKI